MSDCVQRAKESLSAERTLGSARLRDAATLLQQARLEEAIKLLRRFVDTRGDDADAIYLLAEIAIQQGNDRGASELLARCVAIAPDFRAARFKYAHLLLKLSKVTAAADEAQKLLEHDSQNLLFRRLKALCLESAGEYAAASEIWHQLTRQYPEELDCWVRSGHVLRALGAEQESIAAYRKAIALDPASGSAWWALADVKTFAFAPKDAADMETQVHRSLLSADDRIKMHFALGKAYRDLELFEKSFDSYSKANALQRLGIKHDPDVLTRYVNACEGLFTADFFKVRSELGDTSPDPIFIVGMQRAGSTLVEQILSSHSQIEGTHELPELGMLSRELQRAAVKRGLGFPEILEKLQADEFRQMGERYLKTACLHRKLNRPFFTDKMGANFTLVGLLRLILPNAKIIDVRRHPLACGFSIFTQLFPQGENHAYRLKEIGLLYRDYVRLMAHFDSVLPGRIHRVFYEELVAEPEVTVRRLLEYLDLPFENACLRFHETDRAVATVSSQQVRKPIYRDATDYWRKYETWLTPLVNSLGSVLSYYPRPPADLCSKGKNPPT
jgi:tetratricopeptide (TPR) repeat protein